MRDKAYAVFGLGKYGFAAAKELHENGAEVLAVDQDPAVVRDLCDELPLCKCADVTDPEVIRQLGISNFDVVIVAMAGNLEASVMAVTLCKDAGVPTVIAKCGSELHRRILLRVGADQVVFPEQESGVRLAKNLLSSGFIDMISLSKDVSLVEIDVKDEWCGKNLIELNLRRKYGFNIVAIKRGESVDVSINPEQVLEAGTTLIVIANTAKLGRLK
jgi:trk system potassium uptake protein TrkA